MLWSNAGTPDDYWNSRPLGGKLVKVAGWVLSCLVSLTFTGGCERHPAAPASAESGGHAALGEGEELRIISLMPSTTDMLRAFGAWDHVVGVSRFCDTPDSDPRPAVGSGMDPDLEQLLALRPTLVVGTIVQQDYAFVATLEAAHIATVWVDDRSLEQLFEGMIILGGHVGRSTASEQLVTELRDGLDNLSDAALRGAPIPTLLVYDIDPIYAAGPETMVSALMERAGGRNVLTVGDWVQLDLERVLALAPQVIITPNDAAGLRARLEALQAIPAIRNGRVCQVSSPGISQPGPRVLEAAQELAACLNDL